VVAPLLFGILQILLVVATFSMIAILMNRVVEAMVRRELKREEGDEDEMGEIKVD
jgi:hypothetical protein